MFRLHVLGGLRLEGPTGPVTGRAAQKRRLALLARLALARGGSLTRDSLRGLFWAERPESFARQSLSTALYDLRRVLGENALRSAGEDVRVDPAALWCDGVAFEEAADAGRLEEAASLYVGPLLEGVHLSASEGGNGGDRAEEWERWLEGERARLARRQLTVLQGLADARETAGDIDGTIEALLRLGDADPFGARTVLRLMGALERAGEPVRALEQARSYAARVRMQLEAEPDPAVLALEERLRREPPVRASAGESAPRPPADDSPAALSEIASEPALAGAATPWRGSRRPAAESVGGGAAPVAAWRSRVRQLGWGVVAAAAVLAASVAAVAGLLYSRAHAAGGADVAATIAVLPFHNLSGDKENEYFADGVSDDLLTRLARVPRLRVISRISVLRYKGTTKPIRQIGRELGATHVLEGSIRRAGDTVRINAQLIDARTDRHVWAERYDRQAHQVFNVQSEMSEAIAAALVAALTPGQKAILATGGTSDPLAFDLYLRGQRYAEASRPDSAIWWLRRASTVDPGYARPHAALALFYARNLTQGPPWLRDSAVAEARRALQLDPRSTMARCALAGLYMAVQQLPEAERMLREALQIDPSDVTAMNLLSLTLAAEQRFAESSAVRMATLRLDPLNGEAFSLLGWGLAKAADLDLAIRAEQHAIELGFPAYGPLAQFYMFKGDLAAARAVAAEVERVSVPNNPLAVGIRAELAARAGHWTEAERLIRQPFAVSAESDLFPGYVALKLGKRARADSLLAAYERNLRERKAAGFNVLGGEIRLAAVRGERDHAVALLRQLRATGYMHCLPRPTLYYEGLEGYPGYETLREEMCAQAGRIRRELERTGRRAQLLTLLQSPG